MKCLPVVALAVLVLASCQDIAGPSQIGQPQMSHDSEPSVTFDPDLYTALEVIADNGFFPDINNLDEIAYEVDGGGGVTGIATTQQGDVTIPGSTQSRFPAINDAGEVVYAAIFQGSGFKILSTTRGNLSQPVVSSDNLPDINNLGVVSYTHAQAGNSGIFTTDGTTHTKVVANTGRWTKINDSGVVAYVDASRDVYTVSPGGSPQLALTNAPGFAFNNHGQIVYARGANVASTFLYGPDGTRLTTFPISVFMDMNDHGDIVVNGFYTVGNAAAFALVLLTQHPEDFDYPLYTRHVASAIDDLNDELETLVDDGVLDANDLNGLVSKLEGVLAKLDKGNVGAAINQLGAFINQVQALINSGELSPEEGQPLIDVAQGVIDQLTG